MRIILPPYAGLGLYGGCAGRGDRHPHLHPLEEDLAAHRAGRGRPGALLAQGIARWGNFFNQELYGRRQTCRGASPSSVSTACLSIRAHVPFETTGFTVVLLRVGPRHLGAAIALFIVARFLPRLGHSTSPPLGIWYGSTRAVLETFREGWNWTVGGIATAQWIGIVLVIVGVAAIAWNHRRGSQPYPWPAPWQSPERSAAPRRGGG
jgi:phosphatidylglycerol:prolipoprotein diacylglycerol transferase